MSREMWSSLKKFSDGDSLNAGTLNVPISQLGERTEYLYARLKSLRDSGIMSSVILTDVMLSSKEGAEPVVGNVVYLDQERQVVSRAKATMSLYDDFKTADSALSIGILTRKDGNIGDVLIYGSMNLNPDGSPIYVSDIIESGETFRPGRYYLSANEAGKLTANPNGPLIYVCSIGGSVSSMGGFDSGIALVTPQFLDIGTSHIHRTAVLTARPAGTLSTAGYLPIKYTDDDGNVKSTALALRFGGTWTADEQVHYRFYLNNNSANWPNGVVLYYLEWKEDESKAVGGNVLIPGPDVEVPVSNGLTVRLSLPASNKSYAYAVDDAKERTWDVMLFPDAGKGWLDHQPMAVADVTDGDSSSAVALPHVAIRGALDDSPMTVYFAFPGNIQILSIGDIVAFEDATWSDEDESGVKYSRFPYGGINYVFSKDVDAFESDDETLEPVALGPNKADSVHNLVQALNRSSGNGTFAVLESDGGVTAKIVAMGADAISIMSVADGGIVVFNDDTKKCTAYDVSGDNAVTDMKMVAYDANYWIVGTSDVIENIQSYVWKDIGDGFEIMVFQDAVAGGTVATIALDSVLSGVLTDEEPDALYDYVIGFDPQIANYWPPVPAKSAALIVNGVELDNKALLPDSPTVSFGRRTIHWFENSRDRKPWPEAFVSRTDTIDPAYDKAEVMHWVRGFQGATGPVTSLQVRDGAPFKIVGFGTDSYANTGDLEIVGDFNFKMVNGGSAGYIVPKRAKDGRLIGGPVVERIVGGAGISVISQAGSPSGQGTVIVSLDDGSYHSQFNDIALENAEQAKIGMFPYIRLKGYATSIISPSAFTAVMRVPTNLPDGKYYLQLQASVFGENGFVGNSKQFACVKFAYNILPDYRVSDGMSYRNLKSTLLKPDGERTVIIPFGHGDGTIEYNGFDPVIVRTNDSLIKNQDDIVWNAFGEQIPCDSDFYDQSIQPYLRPGYLVGIRIARAVTPSGEGEAYTGPLGFINLSWSLVSESSWNSKVVDPESISVELSNLRQSLSEKLSKDVLSGVDVLTNTAVGIRDAVKATSKVLGANVIK